MSETGSRTNQESRTSQESRTNQELENLNPKLAKLDIVENPEKNSNGVQNLEKNFQTVQKNFQTEKATLPTAETKDFNKSGTKKRSLPGSKGVVRAGGGDSAFTKYNMDFNLPFFSEQPSRKALQFGILYRDTEYALEGCINDIENVKNELLTKLGFPDEYIVQITDDTKIKPTKLNMMKAFSQFASNCTDGDLLFLQYSGHGCGVQDKTGDEEDGKDEALCPLDGGVLVDDWIFENFIRPLEKSKPNTRVFGLFDCCHSGTCLDLAYQYVAFRQPFAYVKQVDTGSKAQNRRSKISMIGFSAALDHQQAVDMQQGMPQGAFTYAVLQILNKHIYSQRRTYRQFILEVDRVLSSQGFKHQASLSSTQPINLDDELYLW